MKILLTLTLLFSLSCATTSANTESSRQPASSMDAENLNQAFLNLMASSAPEQEFISYLERLVSLYFRAEAELKEFDLELENAYIAGTSGFLENSKSYKRMMAMWSIRNRMVDKIAYVYLRLYELRRGPNGSQKNLATKVMQAFTRKLFSLRRVDRIAVQELIDEMQHVTEHLKTKNELPKATSDAQFLRDIQRYRSEIDARAAEEKKKDSFSSEISDLVEAMQKPESDTRTPQAQNIRPSPGPDGNITGRTFPPNTWALTYDDGPHATRTDAILALLKEHNVKATFFQLAQGIKSHPGPANRVKAAGQELANHSYSHADLTKQGAAGLQKEIVQSTQEQSDFFGIRPKFFRCPYGAGTNNSTIRQMIADQGMIHVFWNVDTLDWQDKNPTSVYERTRKQMSIEKNRGVILYHDVHPQTIEATRMLLDYAQSTKGTNLEIRFVTMTQIVKELNGE
jgi:peptidoglycan/xylan/chitin deacetylase (PgdA/CDA1 family)